MSRFVRSAVVACVRTASRLRPASEVLRESARGVQGERGSISAEFAVAVPAVLILLIACVSIIQASTLTLRAADAAADAARFIARGEPAEVAADRVLAAIDGAHLEWSDDGTVVCTTVSVELPRTMPLSGTTIESRSCAMSGGL